MFVTLLCVPRLLTRLTVTGVVREGTGKQRGLPDLGGSHRVSATGVRPRRGQRGLIEQLAGQLGPGVARSGGSDEKIKDGRYKEPRVNSFDEMQQ